MTSKIELAEKLVDALTRDPDLHRLEMEAKRLKRDVDCFKEFREMQRKQIQVTETWIQMLKENHEDELEFILNIVFSKKFQVDFVEVVKTRDIEKIQNFVQTVEWRSNEFMTVALNKLLVLEYLLASVYDSFYATRGHSLITNSQLSFTSQNEWFETFHDFSKYGNLGLEELVEIFERVENPVVTTSHPNQTLTLVQMRLLEIFETCQSLQEDLEKPTLKKVTMTQYTITELLRSCRVTLHDLAVDSNPPDTQISRFLKRKQSRIAQLKIRNLGFSVVDLRERVEDLEAGVLKILISIPSVNSKKMSVENERLTFFSLARRTFSAVLHEARDFLKSSSRFLIPNDLRENIYRDFDENPEKCLDEIYKILHLKDTSKVKPKEVYLNLKKNSKVLTTSFVDLILRDLISDAFSHIWPNWMPKSWEGSDFDGREARRDVMASCVLGGEQNFYRYLATRLKFLLPSLGVPALVLYIKIINSWRDTTRRLEEETQSFQIRYRNAKHDLDFMEVVAKELTRLLETTELDYEPSNEECKFKQILLEILERSESLPELVDKLVESSKKLPSQGNCEEIKKLVQLLKMNKLDLVHDVNEFELQSLTKNELTEIEKQEIGCLRLASLIFDRCVSQAQFRQEETIHILSAHAVKQLLGWKKLQQLERDEELDQLFHCASPQGYPKLLSRVEQLYNSEKITKDHHEEMKKIVKLAGDSRYSIDLQDKVEETEETLEIEELKKKLQKLVLNFETKEDLGEIYEHLDRFMLLRQYLLAERILARETCEEKRRMILFLANRAYASQIEEFDFQNLDSKNQEIADVLFGEPQAKDSKLDLHDLQDLREINFHAAEHVNLLHFVALNPHAFHMILISLYTSILSVASVRYLLLVLGVSPNFVNSKVGCLFENLEISKHMPEEVNKIKLLFPHQDLLVMLARSDCARVGGSIADLARTCINRRFCADKHIRVENGGGTTITRGGSQRRVLEGAEIGKNALYYTRQGQNRESAALSTRRARSHVHRDMLFCAQRVMQAQLGLQQVSFSSEEDEILQILSSTSQKHSTDLLKNQEIEFCLRRRGVWGIDTRVSSRSPGRPRVEPSRDETSLEKARAITTCQNSVVGGRNWHLLTLSLGLEMLKKRFHNFEEIMISLAKKDHNFKIGLRSLEKYLKTFVSPEAMFIFAALVEPDRGVDQEKREIEGLEKSLRLLKELNTKKVYDYVASKERISLLPFHLLVAKARLENHSDLAVETLFLLLRAKENMSGLAGH